MILNIGRKALAALGLIFFFTHANADDHVKKLTFILTNDIHGHLEPTVMKTQTIGGLAYFATQMETLRAQDEYKNGTSGLFLLDSGDQFQGTLISNYDEGHSVFQALNVLNYDAIIPGNHDYDFGPLGWLYDRVVPGITSDNPREVIEKLAGEAHFPMLSANTYIKSSITTSQKEQVELDSQCKPALRSLKDPLDYTFATRPAFLTPYVIVNRAGVRVALIGLDNHSTAATTTSENVSDLCFRDEAETYLELRKSLEGKADVFVILMHNGNSNTSWEASNIAEKINNAYPNGVDLIAAGHTHFTHNNKVGEIYVIQDGAQAKAYGRVDLFYDLDQKKVLTDQTVSQAGNKILTKGVTPNAEVAKIIADLRTLTAPIASREIFTAAEKITKSRIDDSAMAELLTDALRAAANTQISIMNAGGIRSELGAGKIDYEQYFDVVPFANQAVKINQLKWSTLKKLLSTSIRTCGKFGALVQSGLNVEFARTCETGQDMSSDARLTYVALLDGTVLYDEEDGTEADPNSVFSAVTLDFLASGGDSFGAFSEAKVDSKLGIARDMIADQLAKTKPTIHNQVDGRLKNINSAK